MKKIIIILAMVLASLVTVGATSTPAQAETCSNRVSKVHDYINFDTGRTVRVSGIIWYTRCDNGAVVNRTIQAYGGRYKVVEGPNTCAVDNAGDITGYTVNVNTDHDWWEPGAIYVDCQNDGANTASHGAGGVGARAMQFRATTRMHNSPPSNDRYGGTAWKWLG